jgi:hypothetical protein
MLLSPEDYGKQRRLEKLRFRSVRIAARRRSQAAAIMAMKASRLTNKSKISKTDDVEYCVRYFSSVIFWAIFNLWAIFNANGPGTRGVISIFVDSKFVGFPSDLRWLKVDWENSSQPGTSASYPQTGVLYIPFVASATKKSNKVGDACQRGVDQFIEQSGREVPSAICSVNRPGPETKASGPTLGFDSAAETSAAKRPTPDRIAIPTRASDSQPRR